MESHGSFTLKLEDYVVHTYACNGFNELGIVDYRESILKLVSKKSSWILFEHVDDSAGVTPEALRELILTYNEFKKFGCIAIAVDIGSTFGSILEESVFNHIDLPTLASKEQSKLTAFIENII
ncbi:MAG: hypothetical protein MJK12_15590 [Colwellia sp.]|nr:hypothetical protein [Colwellia sp.]